MKKNLHCERVRRGRVENQNSTRMRVGRARVAAFLARARYVTKPYFIDIFANACFDRIAAAHLQGRICAGRAMTFIPVPQGSTRPRYTHFVKPKTVFFVVL